MNMLLASLALLTITDKAELFPENTVYRMGVTTVNNKMFVIPEWNMVIVRLGLDQKDGKISDEVWSTFLGMVGDAVDRQTVRVAGIVLKWLRTDKAANFQRAVPLIRQAARGGARIVCTTECFLDGYAIADKEIPLDRYRQLGEPIPDGAYFQQLADLAKELKIYLIAGMLEADGEDRFNTAVVLGPDGRLIGKYHKQMLEHELVRNTPGSESKVFDTEFGRVGVMICADRRFPEIVSRFCAAGADFLICPSGGMFGSRKNDPIVQQRSRETGKYVVFVHPAEFLVTDPTGDMVSRTILGDRLLIDADQIGQAEDQNHVFFFDLPLH